MDSHPFMLNQKVNPCWNINYRVGVYAPTGDYEVGRLANAGKFLEYRTNRGLDVF